MPLYRITSDFSETGEGGALLEREIAAKAKAGGMRFVGPNTMGIFNAYSNLNVLMSPIKAEPGYVSVISQSGNVGIQILNECFLKHGIGVSKLVSSGNEADIKCEDYLSYMANDEKTKVIILYIESFKNGKEFIRVCKEIKASKPIIIYKAGKTKSGMSAAASHTGAMAGSIDVYRSVFKQYGIIEAESQEEIFDLAGGFITYPLPKGNRVGIITIGGGWGVITADECESRGLVLPPLSPEVFDKLNKLLPKYWSKHNPVDMAAELSLDAHIKSLEAMVSWDGVDAVISLGLNAIEKYLSYYHYDDISKMLNFKKEDMDMFINEIYKQLLINKKTVRTFIEKYNKPVIHVEIGEDNNVFNNSADESKYAKFKSPEGAVKLLKKMYDYYQMKKRLNQ